MTATFPELVVDSPPGGPIMLGVDEVLEVRWANILNEHYTVGGLTGAGKSEWLRFLIKQLAVRTDTALLLGDGKMDEFPAWKPRASCLALGPAACRQMIEWVAEETVRRYSALVDLKDWKPRSFRVGVDGPHIVVILDEVHTLFKAKGAEAFKEKFHDVMTMARAAAITVVLSTQRPSAGTIPPDIRDNTTISVGFRTRNHIHTEMLFGDASVPAHRDLRLPGQCYAQWPAATPPGYVRLRGPRDPKDSILDVRDATRHLRVELDGLKDVILPDLLLPPEPEPEETT
jgi:DNA segregation ATPase FtsK/SpoIIIE-like protein